MNKRPLSMDKYKISRNRYYELYHYCHQYPEWKKKLADLYISYHGIDLNGMPHGSDISDKVANSAIEAAELNYKIKMIEDCAKETDYVIWQELLKAVTQDIPYASLNTYMGERQFVNTRKRFFWLLDRRRERK